MMLNKKLNIREMQAYAALCLYAFSNKIGLKHDSINELIFHLLSMLSASNLPDWEQRGSCLLITGRGDSLPQEINKHIPPESLELFNSLVESCVEVGIVGMYGDSIEQSNCFLDNCIKILKSCEIELPLTDHLSKYRRGNDLWGEVISESELNDLMDIYGVTFY